MGPKIFQIGFNKCGTRTIHLFLKSNRLPAAHWHYGAIARALFQNLANGSSLLAGFEQFQVFTDMEWITDEFALEGFKLFPYLAKEFPDALYILNTRDREDWIRSRLSHRGRGGNYVTRWKSILGLDNDDAVAAVWRQDWDRHHARVLEFFAGGRYRFLTFDIAKDSPEAIARLLPECKLDVTLFEHAGKTAPRQRPAARLARVVEADDEEES